MSGNEGESGCGDVASGGESRMPLGEWESGDLGEGRGEESTLTPLYLRAGDSLAYHLQEFVYKSLIFSIFLQWKARPFPSTSFQSFNNQL